MNIIVLQHIKIEDPGYIKDLMLADGFNLTTIELDEGEKIPDDLSKFDGMFCMGGPMDTYMEQEYPWLIEEKKRIKEFVVNLKKPYLGFCLGCQLLGEVVGGKEIFKYQNHAYGIQFHIEIKDSTVNEWGCVPEYKKALEDQLGNGALEKFDQSAKDNMKDMNNYSTILYNNFKKLL